MSELELRIAVDECSVTIELAGDLDLHGASLFDRSRDAFARCAGDRPITLDLRGVEYLGAAGVSTLILLGQDLRGGSGQIRLREVRPEVTRILELCGVADQFGTRDRTNHHETPTTR